MITTFFASFAFGYCVTDLILSIAYNRAQRQELLKTVENRVNLYKK